MQQQYGSLVTVLLEVNSKTIRHDNLYTGNMYS